MGWSPIIRRIEGFRDRLSADPCGVREEIQAFLADEEGLKPSDRTHLLGLVVLAAKKLGEFEVAEQAALKALAIRSTSAVANTDLLLQLAILRMVQHRPEEAVEIVDQARQLVDCELGKPAPTSKVSRQRRKWIQAMKAAAAVIRGEIFLHESEGTVDQAFSNALEALSLTADLVRATSYSRRVHLSAVTLLCALLVHFGSPEMVAEALRLLEQAEKTLIYRCRLPPEHIHRVKLKWGRALALARMGALPRAERLLIEVVDRLIAAGLKDDAQRAADALIWVIKRTRTPGRAIYFELRYGRLNK